MARVNEGSQFHLLLPFVHSREPRVERVQALADISRSRYVVIATKPVHRLGLPFPKLHLRRL